MSSLDLDDDGQIDLSEFKRAILDEGLETSFMSGVRVMREWFIEKGSLGRCPQR
jgi:hypothetical protein